MRRPTRIAALVALGLAAGAPWVAAAEAPSTPPPPPPDAVEKIRELFVPFDDLNVLLEGAPERVLLGRTEFEALLVKAKKTAETHPPTAAAIVSAEYDVRLADERAQLTGSLVIDVLEDGLHALGLDLAGVGLRRALLDDKDAAIGLADDGRLLVFVEGKGRHALALEMVSPLQATAARQVLNLQVPTPPAARLRLVVPGDVEVKSGAPVASRVFDEAAGVTRIEVVPQRGPLSLVMTLNSRLKRMDRIVVARSVLVDEVTQAFERLHATISLGVLHRAVDEFRFALPAGFDVTDVQTPLLARWAIQDEAGRRVLQVTLREETTDTVVLNVSAVRTGAVPDGWALPHLEPLDVAGQVAVIGLLVEDRLKAESVAPEGLIPIDTAVLARALPPTVLAAEAGAAPVRPVVAYYAPQPAYGLAARFVKPPARLLVTANLLLILEDGGQQVRGGFAMIPEEEKLFAFDFSVPAAWDVAAVTTEKGEPLAFERYGAAGQPARVRVRLPQGVAAGQECRVYFQARSVPKGWFGEWTTAEAAFPVFAAAGARRDTGAIAVEARDDMTVRPGALEHLIPLDENEKAKYGLEGFATNLAYRYEGQPYAAALQVARTAPRLTARTYSFFRIERDALVAHYEIAYDVAEARTRHLEFLLPESTPTALSIRGLDGVTVKEYASEIVTLKGAGAEAKDVAMRRWTALLAERRRGTVRLAVDFTDRYASAEPKGLLMPVVRAAGVVYQSGLVAVEGSAELDVAVREAPRKVDIGELVDAEYQPGRRLLGAYGFVGDTTTVTVDVSRQEEYALPPAIVQRAEMTTVLSARGLGQTAVRFLLRTKDLFLEIRLPQGSTLWSATLDGKPAKPQREAESLLLSLPAAGEGAVRDLLLVYETPVGSMGFWRGVGVPAPRLLLHATRAAEGREVPAADLIWYLYMPTGYQVVRSEGSVAAQEVQAPSLAVAQIAGALGTVSGGVDFDHGALGLVLALVPGARPEIVACRSLARIGARDEESVVGEGYGGLGGAPGAEEATEKAADETTVTNGFALRGAVTGEKKDMLAAVATPAPANGPVPAEKPAAEPAAPPPVAPPVPPGTPPPEKKPPAKPTAGKPVKTPETAAPARQQWSLEGVGSLKIDLEHTGEAVTFQSLGSEARLDLTVVNRPRLDALALALALGVALVGIALTNRPAGRKVLYVLAVGLVATLVPVVTGRIELALAVNASFYAACLLVPYYLVVGAVRWCVRQGRCLAGALAPTATVLVAAACLASAWAGAAAAADAAEAVSPGRVVVEVVEAGPPPKVPEDALILPFDPESKTGVRDAEKVLVPYARYVELWNLANPDARLEAPKPPAPYALAGARYAAALAGDEFLLVEGSLDVDVYTDEYASVPLPLAGGVLAKADLDGKPARLQVAQVDPKAAAQAAKQKAERPAPPAGGLVVLHVSGKGRHRLDVAVRLRLDRRGGWRVAEGRVPAAAATALALRVPQALTEVRLGGVLDRQTYETKAPDESIQTALGPDGALSVQWRPKVSEGQVDQSLTASSTAVLDVEEDRLRLAWSLVLEFRRSERDAFSLEIPAGYLVEKVEGTNVRGWEVRPPAAGEAGSPRLEVALLKRAKDQESLTVSLWRPMVTPAGEAARIEAPVLGVVGALLHSGQITVRRSPLLDVQTVETSGVTRTDLPPPARGAAAAAEESPLGIRPYQAFRFATAPFTITMTATPVALHATARVQTILRVAEREVGLESRAILSVRGRPLHRVRLVVPADLRLDQVSAPGGFEWAVTEEGGRRIVTVYLAAGCQGDVPVIVRGVLGEPPAAEAQAGPREKIAALDLPRLSVLDVAEQQGDLVVQTDPAFEVRAENLRNLDRAFLAAMTEWLGGAQRQRAKLALHYTNPDYAGRLALVAKPPDVTCYTVTNVRVTDRALEEAVLLDFTVREAGVREVAFLLPWWMKDARVSVPLLRQKTVERAGQGDEAPWRVRLELQDEVMGQLRVLVENDRLLTESVQRAPVPVVETGRTDRRYVALESAGRDEVVVARREGLEPLGRQQKEWETVAALFRGGTTQAYLVSADAKDPVLEFSTRERAAVETAKARIGLARTVLVLDAEGAYRVCQVYHMDNRTEQFLEIDLPEGADLWTARVAGEAVKPAVVPAAAGRIVRIPLVKTAAGDLDYAVVLKYGGKLPRLHSLRRVDFPLARTRNINVELSQVELYLPETHAWFDFDSKMTPVTEEGDLEAGVVAYQTRMTERLVQAIRSSDNPFAKARAVANFGQFKEQITLYQDSSVSQYRYNKKVQQELAANSAMLREADQQVQTSAEAPEQIVFDNNDTIRQHFERQKNLRARNVVTDLGPNWADADIPAQPQGQVTVTDGRFNDKWFEANRLENPDLKKEGAAKAQSRVQIPTPATPQARSQRRGGQGQPAAPEVARGKAKEMLQQETQQGQQAFAPSQGGQQAQAAEDLAFRYQQKLQQRAQRDQEVAQETAKSVEGLTTVAGVGGAAVHGGRGPGLPGYYVGNVETGGGLFGGGGGGGGEAAGLASLDVELPARGTLYRFTMPRAEIDIAARPVSQPLIDSLIRIGGVLVALAVLALGRRFWKRGGLPPAVRPAAALILIILAAIGLVGGVFPIASFVVLVVAIVWRVRLAIERRRAAMAA